MKITSALTRIVLNCAGIVFGGIIVAILTGKPFLMQLNIGICIGVAIAHFTVYMDTRA